MPGAQGALAAPFRSGPGRPDAQVFGLQNFTLPSETLLLAIAFKHRATRPRSGGHCGQRHSAGLPGASSSIKEEKIAMKKNAIRFLITAFALAALSLSTVA